MQSDIMLRVIMLSDFILRVIMLSEVMLRVIMPSDIVLSVIMLSDIMIITSPSKIFVSKAGAYLTVLYSNGFSLEIL